MIVVKLISGLGNQLFQYALGRQLALRCGVPLKLDLGFFGTQNLRSYKLHYYNIAAEVATEKEVERFVGQSITRKLYRKVQKLLPKHKRSVYEEAEWWTYEPHLLQAGPNVYVNGYWQHCSYYKNLPPQIFKELTPAKPICGEPQAILSSIQAAENAVSIHFRRGDYVTDKKAAELMGILPETYYRGAVSSIMETVANPSFYIFSDDAEWVQRHVKIEAPVTFVNVSGADADCTELYLMSQCRHNIIANSSFSWWGAFLNQNPNKQVIMPAQWVVSPHLNKRIELGFSSWTKI